MNGVNRLATKGEKYYRLPTKREKKITDYRQKKKLTDYRHGPPLSIFVFRKKRAKELFVFFLAYEVTTLKVQSTPDNSNLQGKSKKGSSYQEIELSGFRRK